MLRKCHNTSIPIIDQNDSGNMTSFIPVFPTVSPQVTFGMTMAYIVAYSILFLGVYIQLWLILYYNYKRFSFQTVFLYLCLLWSGLRATLFSFYFKNMIKATELPLVLYWLFYGFPVCLQFCTLCLLSLYFAQVMFKAKSKYAANPNRYVIPLRVVCLFVVTVFFVMNLSCAVIQHNNAHTDMPSDDLLRNILVARVLINDLLFVICAISLAYFFFKISKTTSANVLLEAKGTTVCRALSWGIVIVLLYVSRAVYNLIAISPLRCSKLSEFNFDWYNVSDQADLANLEKQMPYLVFGFVLFVWEFLPTSLTLYFFKVRKPESTMHSNLAALARNGYNARVYFFDNPQNYESEEDLSSNFLRVKPDAFFASSAQSMKNGRMRSRSEGVSSSSDTRRSTGITPIS